MVYTQRRPTAGLLPIYLFINGAVAAINGHCPPLGPVLPAPKAPTTSESIQGAVSAISDVFANITAGFDSTGISLAIQSIHETSPMLELHHTPSILDPRGTKIINSQSVYRLGSISKFFPVLALLQSGVRLDDPITQYVPELLQLKGETDEVDDITTVRWEEVTIGALASHMSGIGTDLVTDLASIPNDWTQLGLPEVDPASLNGCAGVLGLPACNRTQFFRDFGKRHPVYAPFSNPTYSNIGSVILGFAVEAVTNLSYDEYIHQAILNPLGMTNTTIFNGPEDDAWGFIPVNETWWGSSLGYEDMAGGFYSNTVDLLNFGVSILQNRPIDAVTTRKWMKPLTSTSSAGFQLGAPWEIYRVHNVTEDQRLIELYCKSGNLNTYNNILCLVPDYDFVLTLLSGGPLSGPDLVETTVSTVMSVILPAIEDAGQAEAEANFAGTYVDAGTNSSVTLSVDNGPGLAVSNWTVRNVDVVDNYAYFSALSSSKPRELSLSVRLYPTNLKAGCKTSWRAVFDNGTPEALAEKDASRIWADGSCVTWASMDRLTYAYKSIDDFVVTQGDDGRATELNLRAFGVNLQKQG